MPLTEVDFVASNNADIRRSFSFTDGVAATVPWNAVAAWAALATYQSTSPASVVTFAGDLYVANPSNIPTSWTSGSTFDATKWVKVGDATIYGAPAFDLTGSRLEMSIVALTDDGLSIDETGPRLDLASDGDSPALTITNPSGGAVDLSVPASEARTLTPRFGGYGYDLLAVFTATGHVVRLMYGKIEVDLGYTAP